MAVTITSKIYEDYDEQLREALKEPSPVSPEVAKLQAQLTDLRERYRRDISTYESRIEKLTHSLNYALSIDDAYALLSKYMKVNKMDGKLPKNNSIIKEFLKQLAFKDEPITDELCD